MEDHRVNGQPVVDIQRRLRQLAHDTGTDVEDVVSWLAARYDPEKALTVLLTH